MEIFTIKPHPMLRCNLKVPPLERWNRWLLVDIDIETQNIPLTSILLTIQYDIDEKIKYCYKFICKNSLLEIVDYNLLEWNLDENESSLVYNKKDVYIFEELYGFYDGRPI